MLNDYEKLDKKFIEGLTEDQIDNIFIARMFWEFVDLMTADEMTLSFVDYPGLDTWENVYDKTWECIQKVVEKGLMVCSISPDKTFTGEIISSEKAQIYAIMEHTCEPGSEYSILFDITRKGYKFMKTIITEYEPVFDELRRLTKETIAKEEALDPYN